MKVALATCLIVGLLPSLAITQIFETPVQIKKENWQSEGFVVQNHDSTAKLDIYTQFDNISIVSKTFFDYLGGNITLGNIIGSRPNHHLHHYATFSDNSSEGIRFSPYGNCRTSGTELSVVLRRYDAGQAAAFRPCEGTSHTLDLYPDSKNSQGKLVTSNLGTSEHPWNKVKANFVESVALNTSFLHFPTSHGYISTNWAPNADLDIAVGDDFVIELRNSGGNSEFLVQQATGRDLFRVSHSGNLYAKNIPYGDRANMQYEASSGRFYYDNSSRRYKENITPFSTDFRKVLQVQPVTYTRPGDSETWEIGYLAEDMEDLGLHELLFYDGAGKVESFNYEKMIIYVVELLKQQDRQIRHLTEQLREVKN